MKTLLLLRHAKSSWSDPTLADFDRPLNKRGQKAAAVIGKVLRNNSIDFDLCLSSTSVRTRQTAELVFRESGMQPQIIFRDDLYHASAEQITNILQQVDEPHSTVLVIGHNPGFQELLTRLTGDEQGFPTAALATVELPIEQWSDMRDQTRGLLTEMWRPKELEQD
jgi:phosphohistidine phosphatase